MELPMAIVIGVLFATGTYMILRPNLIRVVMGFSLYSNAVNLLLIVCGGYAVTRQAPFVTDAEATVASLSGTMMDPLPPDIILTAIVISFAVGALLLTICYRVYLDHGTDNPSELPVADLEGHVAGDNGDDASSAGDPALNVPIPPPSSPYEGQATFAGK